MLNNTIENNFLKIFQKSYMGLKLRESSGSMYFNKIIIISQLIGTRT